MQAPLSTRAERPDRTALLPFGEPLPQPARRHQVKLFIFNVGSARVKLGRAARHNTLMLRDKNLVPLSHQHQHALGLCVRIGRAIQQQGSDLKFWQDEIVRQFHDEISFHFAAEEKVLFPAAARISSLSTLVEQLLIEHAILRKAVQQAQAHEMNSADLQMFAAGLSEHVRKEEQQLFEGMQRSLSSQDLARLGAEFDHFFASSGMPGATCEIRIPGQNGAA